MHKPNNLAEVSIEVSTEVSVDACIKSCAEYQPRRLAQAVAQLMLSQIARDTSSTELSIFLGPGLTTYTVADQLAREPRLADILLGTHFLEIACLLHAMKRSVTTDRHQWDWGVVAVHHVDAEGQLWIANAQLDPLTQDALRVNCRRRLLLIESQTFTTVGYRLPVHMPADHTLVLKIPSHPSLPLHIST